MKARLPVLSSRPSESRRQPALNAERFVSPRTLVCVVGDDDAVACLEFALALVTAIGAAGGVPAALLTSSAGEWSPSAVVRLRAAGACEVRIVRGPDIAPTTMTALAELAAGTICVGIGWPLATCVEGALLIRVGGPSVGPGLQQADAVDLYTGIASPGVATILGTWLAQRLDASTPNRYPATVAERTNP